MAELCARGDGELGGIVEARIEEGALSVHLCIGYVRVPIADRAPGAGPRMVVDARESIRGRIKRGRGLAVGAERLAVDRELGVILARAPALQHLAHGRIV